MRAVVVDPRGAPCRRTYRSPSARASSCEVLACGLCGSDVEKLTPAFAGRVLGHEVVARTADGRRVALVHHAPCGSCERCSAGRESTCEAFRPRRSSREASRSACSRPRGGSSSPTGSTTRAERAVEPLACVLRGAERVPRGRVLVVGTWVRRTALRAGARAPRRRRLRDRRRPAQGGPRARRAGRRCGDLRAGRRRHGARRALAGRDDAALRRCRAGAERSRVPARAHGARLALLHPAPHAGGGRRCCPSSTSRSRPCCRSSGSARGSRRSGRARR